MKHRKGITLPEIKQVAAEAISYFNINKYLNAFSEAEIISLCKHADPDVFNDISVADNITVQENFRWEKVRPKRLSRMMARAIDLGFMHLLDRINLSGMKIPIRDLRSLLRRLPEIVERFNIDLKKVSDTEAHMLLELGKPYFMENINVRDRKFTISQQFDICRAYDFQRSALSLFNCKNFDGFQTKEIAKHTADENIDLVDMNNMKLVDWLDLLIDQPDMYKHCNILNYKNDPISHLISMAVMSNDDQVYSLVKSKDLDEVSPFGWEKLMSHRPEMFKDVCDYRKMDALNKRNVLASHPKLTEFTRK